MMTGYVISVHLTEFQKVRMQEAKKFAEQYPSDMRGIIIENSPFLICGVLLLIGLIWLP